MPDVLARFAEVWAVDFEFIARPGEHPSPVCCVAIELRSGRVVRRWGHDLALPMAFGVDAVFLAFYAPAELSCLLALGWPLPANVLDLFAEFKVFTNGRDAELCIGGASLLAALTHFGLSHLDPEVKAHWRERILAGPPYIEADRVGILDYCTSDVVALAHLLPRLVAGLASRPFWLEHALQRGRYMRAVARIEHTGTPVDEVLFRHLAAHWASIKVALIDDLRAEYPFFVGSTLKYEAFEQWLMARSIPWLRTETGRLSLGEDTFKQMVRSYPQLAPVRELVQNLAKLRVADLAVGTDGRNRTMLSPFRAKSGRNQPSASKFIFAPAVWLRSLIRPEPGRALAYIDFSSQEIGIAAALSNDLAMQRAYRSGDPYLAFAVDAGLAPAGATKATHAEVRNRCKALVLGTLYGMQEQTLGQTMGVPPVEARLLLQAHRRTYATFWAWSQRVTDHAMLAGYLDTCFGWRLHVTRDTRPTSLLNHPMQAHGAEMLRLACSLVTEAGIAVCAPVHDALLIEAPEGDIEAVVQQARALMARASGVVLEGFEIRTDADIIRPPDRYSDPRGEAMWAAVMARLAQVSAPDEVGPEVSGSSRPAGATIDAVAIAVSDSR